MTTTKKGDELASKLNPLIGTTLAIRETCSRICRNAATLHRLNEEMCNGPHWMDNSDRNIGSLYRAGLLDEHAAAVERHSKRMERWEAETEAGHDRIVARMVDLVANLPHTDFGPFTLDAESDPRGCSVVLAPEAAGFRGDSWGDRNGACVP